MVERIARAIFEYDVAHIPKVAGDNGWDGPLLNERGRNFWRDRVRFAIKAMRDPSVDMIDAGRNIGPDAPYGLSETIKRWQAMIDEALK